MRHRLIAFGLVVILALAAVATGFEPFATIGAFALMIVVALVGLFILITAVLALKSAIFDHSVSRYRRFN